MSKDLDHNNTSSYLTKYEPSFSPIKTQRFKKELMKSFRAQFVRQKADGQLVVDTVFGEDHPYTLAITNNLFRTC